MTAGLSDCCIAVAARSAGAAIFTLDKHFAMIRAGAGIRLHELSP